jgi:5'-methylthioadenosine phosphorylase
MSAPRPKGSRLCLIHGNSLPEAADPVEGKRVTIDAGGALPVEATDGGDIVGIPRHGFDRSIPAHLVDHAANIRAACELGCDRVLALGSAGSLDSDLKVGTLVCPEDFYAPETAPSFYRDPRGHSVPGFDSEWRRIVLSAWKSLTETELEDGGVYAQTIGPRFETPAEVKVLANYADMVGMTVAAEAVLAGEAALAYAAVCSIDNLANGLLDRALTVDEYRRNRDKNARKLADDLSFVLPALAKGIPGS